MKAQSSRRHRWHGQALTEFAVVLPVFLLLFLGIIQFGLYTLAQSALIFATMQGTRAAALAGADPAANTTICAAIESALESSRLDPVNLGNVTIYSGSGLSSPGDNPSAHDVGTCTTAGAWTYATAADSTGWPPNVRGVGASASAVGVHLSYTFHFVIPWFGTTTQLQHSAILQIEGQSPLGPTS